MINPKSLANLTNAGKGRPKKEKEEKYIKKLISLSPSSVEWLEQQPNQSQAIERLIQEKMKEN